MITHHKLIAAIAATAISAMMSPAYAYLRSPSTLSPGDYCDTECQSSECMRMFKTNLDIDVDQMNYLPDCSDVDTTDTYGESCWLNKSKGNYMVCNYDGETACSFFFATGGLNDYRDGYFYSNWVRFTSAVVLRSKSKIIDDSYYNCTAQITLEYGCAANMYATSGTGTSSIKCTACPQSGHSPEGNTSISDCYLPKGTSFCDDTGCGEITENCPY